MVLGRLLNAVWCLVARGELICLLHGERISDGGRAHCCCKHENIDWSENKWKDEEYDSRTCNDCFKTVYNPNKKT